MIQLPEDVFDQALRATYATGKGGIPDLAAFAEVIVEWFDQTYRLSDPRHLVKVDADGWTVQHPQSCRPNLFTCPWVGVDGPDRTVLDAAVEAGYYGVFVGDIIGGTALTLSNPVDPS